MGACLSACAGRSQDWIEQLDKHVNVLFVPGGSYFGGFHPFVAACQNLLPFDRGGTPALWDLPDAPSVRVTLPPTGGHFSPSVGGDLPHENRSTDSRCADRSSPRCDGGYPPRHCCAVFPRPSTCQHCQLAWPGPATTLRLCLDQRCLYTP